MTTRSAAWSPQFIARIGGLLLLISLVAGGFGEFYVPSKVIVSSDAAATAKNIVAFGWLYRLGYAGYIVEALCDTGLTLVFYLLLKPVGRELALLAFLLRIISTAVFAAAELFYFAPTVILGGANTLKAFPPDQLNALSLLSLKLYGYGAIVPTVFYGVAWIVLGYLMWKSRYLPRLLGALLILAGVSTVFRNLALILAPAYASSYLLLPLVGGGLFLMLWLLVRGVNVRKWQEWQQPADSVASAPDKSVPKTLAAFRTAAFSK
ncbi:MAG: DUF4386 domain-containing protein [Proteobacteria bacterium]|nr:DUF4386 domain-containing protein [Pseudomonadota bacterium]